MPVILDEERRDGYLLQRWEIYPDPDSIVPMLMLVPDTAIRKSPAPGVLCLPGKGSRQVGHARSTPRFQSV